MTVKRLAFFHLGAEYITSGPMRFLFSFKDTFLSMKPMKRAWPMLQISLLVIKAQSNLVSWFRSFCIFLAFKDSNFSELY